MPPPLPAASTVLLTASTGRLSVTTVLSSPSTVLLTGSTELSTASTVLFTPSTQLRTPSTVLSGRSTVLRAPSTEQFARSTVLSKSSTVLRARLTERRTPSTVLSNPSTVRPTGSTELRTACVHMESGSPAAPDSLGGHRPRLGERWVVSTPRNSPVPQSARQFGIPREHLGAGAHLRWQVRTLGEFIKEPDRLRFRLHFVGGRGFGGEPGVEAVGEVGAGVFAVPPSG
jgi:hypothetical protein